MRRTPPPKLPCSCPGCEQFDRELDAHLVRIRDGTVTLEDRQRVERMARRCDKPHRVVGNG